MVENIEKVIKIAEKAGEAVLDIYHRNFLSYEKEDKSPVTEADLIANKIILKELRKYGYGILSEESQDNLTCLKKEKVWIVDPLDGTTDFIQKTGDFSIMIGLAQKGEPVLGVVYQPTENKIYFSQKGKGAYLKTKDFLKKLRVSLRENKIRLAVSRFHLDSAEMSLANKLNVQKIKKMGSVGLKIGLIAEGKADLYFTKTSKTHRWDSCAPEIILKEAGGKITDLEGKKLFSNRKQTKNLKGLLATNGLIHQKVIKIINHPIKKVDRFKNSQ